MTDSERTSVVRVLDLVAAGYRLDAAMDKVAPAPRSNLGRNLEARHERHRQVRALAWESLAASVSAYSRALNQHARDAAAWVHNGWSPEVGAEA